MPPDPIGGLIESVRRMVLSIGENYPPYLPLTGEPIEPLTETAAQVMSVEIGRALRGASPKALAPAHADRLRALGQP